LLKFEVFSFPEDFNSEAERAVSENDRAHLILLGLELSGMSWEAGAQMLLTNCLESYPKPESTDRVVLFTGHRVDSPNRKKPRFPSQAEPRAKDAILTLLKDQQALGVVTGVAGGANGGDILFLESCHELGIPFHMQLALPEDQFIEASVDAPAGKWVERFRVLAQASTPRVLAQNQDLPAWLADKPDYNFWERNNLWLISTALALAPKKFILVALWDGERGDGAGGTEHMVRVAQQQGAEFIHLDTRKLFVT
jgi:hypothetical protein